VKQFFDVKEATVSLTKTSQMLTKEISARVSESKHNIETQYRV
jgi:hypothetical protein